MPAKNISEDKAQKLAELIECKPGQVSSMSLTKDAGVDITLLAFSEGEIVSEQSYSSDVLYLVVEGAACAVLPNKRIDIHEGEIVKVAASTLHAIEHVARPAEETRTTDEGTHHASHASGFKILQINLQH